MTDHTKEPWSRETPCPGECCWHIIGADGERINYPELSDNDSRRIVACVNALQGYEIDDSATPGWATFTIQLGIRDAFANRKQIKTLTEQRDELLVALKAAVDWAKPMEEAPRGSRPDWFGVARAAITKAEAKCQ